jgi:hypothetical protein
MQQPAPNYVIPAVLLGALGALWGRTPTRISPFQFGTAKTGSGEKKALSAAGFCDEQGRITAQAQPVLDILGNATSFTRMYLSGGPNPYEYIVCFAPGGASASLVNIRGDMQIDTPALVPMFLTMAAETIGSSMYRSSPFEETLSPPEAVVLAGMIDLQRKAALRSLTGDVRTDGSLMDPASIQAACSGGNNDNQWLAPVILDLAGTGGIPGAEDFRKALDSLVTRGLIRRSGSSFQLNDDVQFLARRMLIFDTALTLTAGHLGNDGRVTVAGFTCLQAGVHDLIVVDVSGDTVGIKSISSFAILGLVRTFLSDASELEKLEAPAAPVTAAPARKFCAQCGTAIQPGRKFCGSCGAKI